MRLGELLIKGGFLTQEALEEALDWQVLYGGRLGTNLLELALVDESHLARTLGHQLGCEVTWGDIQVDPTLISLVPKHVADRWEIVPWKLERRRLKILCAEIKLDVLDKLGFKIGRACVPVVAPEFRIFNLLRVHYGSVRQMRALDFGVVPREGRRKKKEVEKAPAKEPEEELIDESAFNEIYNRVVGSQAAGAVAGGQAAGATTADLQWPTLPGFTSVADDDATWRPTAPAPPPQVAQSGQPLAPAPIAPPVFSPPQTTRRPTSTANPTPNPIPTANPNATPTPNATVDCERASPPPPAPAPAQAAPQAAEALEALPEDAILGAVVEAGRPPTGLVGPGGGRGGTGAAEGTPPPGGGDAVRQRGAARGERAQAQGGRAPDGPPDQTLAPVAWEEPAPQDPAVDETPIDFKEALRLLEGVRDRDAIAHIVLRASRSKAARALLLQVQGGVALGWDGLGEGLSGGAARSVAVPLAAPSAFQLVVKTRSHFMGPLQKTPLNIRFLAACGKKVPLSSLLVPILHRGRVSHLLYLDNGHRQQAPTDVGEMLILSQRIARTVEALVEKKRRAARG